MANYNLTQTGDEVQAYIDSIPVIDVTGTLSGSNIVFATNPYTQIAANYAADCGTVVRLTVGTKIYIVRISGYDGTNYTGFVKDGDDFVSLTIGSSSASGTISSPSFSTGEALSDVGIDATPTQNSNNLVKSGGVADVIEGGLINYEKGFILNESGDMAGYASWCIQLGYTPVNYGDVLTWNSGGVLSSANLIIYDSAKTKIGNYYCSPAERTKTMPLTNAAFVRLSFLYSGIDSVYLKVNNDIVWKPCDDFAGLSTRLDSLINAVGVSVPFSTAVVKTLLSQGYIYRYNGAVKNGAINFFSQKINVEGYSQIEFVGNHSTNSNGDVGAAFYDENGAYLSGVVYDGGASEETYKTYTIDIPNGAKYFAYSINKNFATYSSEVNLINVSLSEIVERDNARLESVIPDALTWVEGKQVYTNEGVGNTCNYRVYDSSGFRYIKTPCSPQSKIYFDGTLQGGNSPRLWCFLNANNVILSVATASELLTNSEIQAPDNAAWVVLNDKLGTGSVFIYENKPISIRVEELENGTKNSGRRFSNCKSFGTQPSANGEQSSFCNVTSNGYTELINSVYEPLRTANPNYIKRYNIGLDASGTIDMYAYIFEPRYYQETIYLQAGIHGIEVDAVACLARIMQLITNATDDDDLMFMRQNVRIIVVPCVNVWGFSQYPKNNNNASGEGLQQWNTEPAPQEIVNVKAFLADYLSDISFMLDMHTTTNSTYYDFYGNIQPHAQNVRTIFRTNSWLCDHYAKDGRTVDDQYLGYHNYADNNLFRLYYYYECGVETATLELSDYYWDTSLSTSPVITMGVTMWLNYIIQMANDFYRFAGFDIPNEDYRESRG